MEKWPNHFISGKQLQKRPKGNPALNCSKPEVDFTNMFTSSFYALFVLLGASCVKALIKTLMKLKPVCDVR
jgi:hypothetical protein